MLHIFFYSIQFYSFHMCKHNQNGTELNFHILNLKTAIWCDLIYSQH